MFGLFWHPGFGVFYLTFSGLWKHVNVDFATQFYALPTTAPTELQLSPPLARPARPGQLVGSLRSPNALSLTCPAIRLTPPTAPGENWPTEVETRLETAELMEIPREVHFEPLQALPPRVIRTGTSRARRRGGLEQQLLARRPSRVICWLCMNSWTFPPYAASTSKRLHAHAIHDTFSNVRASRVHPSKPARNLGPRILHRSASESELELSESYE